jgi:hypothetical protein
VNKIAIVVIMTIALLALCFIAPVLAAPTNGQKVPVIFTLNPITTKVPVPGESWYTPSGVFHVMGRVETSSVVIKIGDTSYNGLIVMTSHGMWNPQEKTMSLSTEDILYITNDGSPNGFAGDGHLRLYNWVWGTPPSWTDSVIFHIWHGFGSFEGQTILLSYEGPRTPMATGWCLKS